MTRSDVLTRLATALVFAVFVVGDIYILLVAYHYETQGTTAPLIYLILAGAVSVSLANGVADTVRDTIYSVRASRAAGKEARRG